MKRTADRLFGKDYMWSVLGAGRMQMQIAAMSAAQGGNVLAADDATGRLDDPGHAGDEVGVLEPLSVHVVVVTLEQLLLERDTRQRRADHEYAGQHVALVVDALRVHAAGDRDDRVHRG